MNKKTSVCLGPAGIISVAGAVAAMCATSVVHSAGFQISEQTVAGMGRAFAGAGVAGDDASDMFYNPAGMMLSDDRQIQLGASVLDITGEFSNQGSTQRLFTGNGFAILPTRGSNADGGGTEAVPHLYYTGERRGNLKYGLSISAPFGLTTEYDSGWVGRYHALKSELRAIDINPSIAWQVNDSVSLGAGLSIQKVDATLSRAIFQGPTAPDGESTIEGDNTGVGFNLGAMFTPGDNTRIGIGFRSKIKQDVEGTLTISGTPRDAVLPATASVDLPETVYLSAAHDINDQWSVYGSVRWTNWSRFEELRIKLAGGLLPDDVTVENWDDSTTISLGAAYRVNDAWTLRFGYSKDGSPVPDAAHRTPRIPDADRDWVTLGASYRPKANMRVDFSYARIEADDGPLHNTVNLVSSAPGAFTDTLRGSFESSSVNIVGVQVLWEL